MLRFAVIRSCPGRDPVMKVRQPAKMTAVSVQEAMTMIILLRNRMSELRPVVATLLHAKPFEGVPGAEHWVKLAMNSLLEGNIADGRAGDVIEMLADLSASK